MFAKTRLHSCRMCGTPVIWFYKALESHLKYHKKMTVKTYMDKYSDRDGRLLETPEEERVNSEAKRLACPECGVALTGFYHMYSHRLNHIRTKWALNVRFQSVVSKFREQLQLASCKWCNCARGTVLKDALDIHMSYYHGIGKEVPKEEPTARPPHAQSPASDSGSELEVTDDEGGEEMDLQLPENNVAKVTKVI